MAVFGYIMSHHVGGDESDVWRLTDRGEFVSLGGLILRSAGSLTCCSHGSRRYCEKKSQQTPREMQQVQFPWWQTQQHWLMGVERENTGGGAFSDSLKTYGLIFVPLVSSRGLFKGFRRSCCWQEGILMSWSIRAALFYFNFMLFLSFNHFFSFYIIFLFIYFVFIFIILSILFFLYFIFNFQSSKFPPKKCYCLVLI